MIAGLLSKVLIAAVCIVALLCAWCFFTPVRAPAIHGLVDGIVVEKYAHRMLLFSHGRVVRRYTVALGRGGLGPKERAGDNRVPEGVYRIVGRNARSAFHLSLRIGYPTADQASAARRLGMDPGGDVMIHGLRRGLGWLSPWYAAIDWTRGCVAVSDQQIEDIWAIVPDGTPIRIIA